MKTADNRIRSYIEGALAKQGIPVTKGGRAIARVNHGMLVADCHGLLNHDDCQGHQPDVDYRSMENAHKRCPCNGAELVAPGMAMLCGSCGAEHVVKFPKPDTLQRIVDLLSVRPIEMFQNWEPRESVEDLLVENIENGIFPEDM